MRIIRNAAQCALCGTEIESTHVHDYVACQCGEIFVDGGKSYLRAGARDLDSFIDLAEYEEDDD